MPVAGAAADLAGDEANVVADQEGDDGGHVARFPIRPRSNADPAPAAAGDAGQRSDYAQRLRLVRGQREIRYGRQSVVSVTASPACRPG